MRPIGDEHVTKTQLALRRVRRAIVLGELAPGQRLLQNALAEQLGISPTPIREALRALEATGVVAYVPNRGMRVIEVSSEEAEEIYEIRAALEPLAFRLAAPRYGEIAARLSVLVEEMTAAIDDGAISRLKQLDHEFHFLVYEAAQRPRLLEIIEGLWAMYPEDLFELVPERARVSLADHRELTQAIAAGAADRVETVARRHISTALEMLLALQRSASETEGTAAVSASHGRPR